MSRHLHAFSTRPRIEVLGENDVLHTKYLKMKEFLCVDVDLEQLNVIFLESYDYESLVSWIPRYDRIGLFRDLTLDEFRKWYYADRRYLNKKEG